MKIEIPNRGSIFAQRMNIKKRHCEINSVFTQCNSRSENTLFSQCVLHVDNTVTYHGVITVFITVAIKMC